MPDSLPFYKRPWVWVVFGILVILLPFGIHLSQQIGDAEWWRREAVIYNREHAVPDEENAAPFYRSMSFGFGGPLLTLVSDWRLPMGASDLLPLAEQDAALDELIETTRKPHCFYGFDTKAHDPASTPLPYLSRVRAAANLLSLRARQRAAEGKPEQAAEDLLAAARLGFHHQGGMLVNSLVGAACNGRAWSGIERFCMDTPPKPETLEAMASEIYTLSARRPPLEEFWKCERIFGRGELELLYRPGDEMIKIMNTTMGTGPSTAPLLVGTGIWLWQATTHPIDKCRRDFDDEFAILSKEKPTAADLARLKQIETQGSVFAGLLLPALDKAQAAFKKDRAMERGIRILLLLRAQRLRTGTYPESLEALKAATKLEIPDDPFSGKPFVYKRLEEDDFLLYSIGPDGVDNGGSDGSLFNYRSGDIVLGRPPKK